MTRSRDRPAQRSAAPRAAFTALLIAACAGTWLQTEIPLGSSFEEHCLEAAIRDAPGTELVDEEPFPFNSQAFKIYRVRLSEIHVGGAPATAYVYQSEGRGDPLALRFETARLTEAAAARVGAELARESVRLFERIYERCSSEPLEHGQLSCSRILPSRKTVIIDCQENTPLDEHSGARRPGSRRLGARDVRLGSLEPVLHVAPDASPLSVGVN